jgi:hypothetical protein
VPRFNRLSLSLASAAAVALASLPLGITPASAARVTEGTTSSIGVVEESPYTSQFNLKTQSASTVLVARNGTVSALDILIFINSISETLTNFLDYITRRPIK